MRSQHFVTPRQQSQKNLRFSELRYRRLFESAQDGILILNAETGQIVDANPFLKKILGYSQAELLGKELWQIGVFKDIFDSKKAFQELQSKGYIRYKDLPLQTKTGHPIDVEFISNVYVVDHQKVIQCNIRDITKRRKAERAAKSRTKELERLSKSQQEIKRAMLNVMEDLEAAKALIELEKAKDEAMLASIGEGLIAVDNQRKIITMNQAAEKMLGWKVKEVLGQEITSLPLEDEAGQLMPLDKRPTQLALVTGKVINQTYFFVRKDKTRFPIAINVTPIKLGGKIIGAIDIFRDITQEREIDQAKSEFVSLASHQLRTPLGISKWYLEAIMNEKHFTETSSVAQEYLKEVYKSNERLLVLVRNLLSISRIDQGKSRGSSELVDSIPILTEVIKELNILALKNQVTIQLEIEKTVPNLFIDPLRFQEVIENLLTNAVTYSHQQGVVKVLVEQKDGLVSIAVADTGIGIASEDQKKLFSKFFRSEAAMTKNAEGSGLGLYVVKAYVESWGGEVTVKSELGKGSTFTITLPLKMASQNN